MSSGHVGTKGTPRQLVLLLSDGRFDRENKDRLRKLVREMNERGQLLVLIGALNALQIFLCSLHVPFVTCAVGSACRYFPEL